MVTDRTDEELVAAARAGEQAAFASLVRRNTQLVYRVALRMTGNRSEAEDVLQDAFLQLHSRLHLFQGQARLSTWLHRIAVNAALMHLRRRRSRPAEQLPDYEPAFDADGTWHPLDAHSSCVLRTDELMEHRELARVALDAVGRLPEQYRAPFVLRDLEGLSTKEAAGLLGLDDNLLRQRLHRARLTLRAHLVRLVGAER